MQRAIMATVSLTELSNPPVIYSDFMSNMDTHPVKGDLALLTNVDAVKRSIRNLLTTNFYERPYQPRIGSGLTGLLFEQINPTAEITLRNAIIACITNHEPRATLLNVTVDVDYDTGSISSSITFSTVNNIAPVTLTVALVRAR